MCSTVDSVIVKRSTPSGDCFCSVINLFTSTKKYLCLTAAFSGSDLLAARSL